MLSRSDAGVFTIRGPRQRPRLPQHRRREEQWVKPPEWLGKKASPKDREAKDEEGQKEERRDRRYPRAEGRA